MLPHWLTRFMWLPITKRRPVPGRCVIVTWRNNSGDAGGRHACYMTERSHEGKALGPGFVCWYSGVALGEISHWMPPLLQPAK